MIDLFERHPEYKSVKYGVSLVMLGGVRDDGDRERVRVLQEQIDEAGLTVTHQLTTEVDSNCAKCVIHNAARLS